MTQLTTSQNGTEVDFPHGISPALIDWMKERHSKGLSTDIIAHLRSLEETQRIASEGLKNNLQGKCNLESKLANADSEINQLRAALDDTLRRNRELVDTIVRLKVAVFDLFMANRIMPAKLDNGPDGS